MQPIIHHRVWSTANYESNSCPIICQLGPLLLSNYGWVFGTILTILEQYDPVHKQIVSSKAQLTKDLKD